MFLYEKGKKKTKDIHWVRMYSNVYGVCPWTTSWVCFDAFAPLLPSSRKHKTRFSFFTFRRRVGPRSLHSLSKCAVCKFVLRCFCFVLLLHGKRRMSLREAKTEKPKEKIQQRKRRGRGCSCWSHIETSVFWTKVNNQSGQITQIFKSKMQKLCSEGNLNPVDCAADQSIVSIASCEHSFALRPSFPGFTLSIYVLRSESSVRPAVLKDARIKRRCLNWPQVSLDPPWREENPLNSADWKPFVFMVETWSCSVSPHL